MQEKLWTSTIYLVLNRILRFLRPSSFSYLASWSIAILLFTGPVFSVIRILGNAVAVEVVRTGCGWLMVEQGARPDVGLSFSLMRGRLGSSCRTHTWDACGIPEASSLTSSSRIAAVVVGVDGDNALWGASLWVALELPGKGTTLQSSPSWVIAAPISSSTNSASAAYEAKSMVDPIGGVQGLPAVAGDDGRESYQRSDETVSDP